jgi:8-oxo-dGTP pyrophosphatase MutT (NUDIX family)
MTVKHATASTFIFAYFHDGWRLGLIEHPRYARHMIPGGHVEDFESQADAALREVEEESGLRVRLVKLPTPPLPTGFAPPQVTPPWWIVEVPAPADNHLSEHHIHVDHLYVAVADDPTPVAGAAHPFAWFSESQLAELRMFEDTRLVAKVLFSCIDDLAAGRLDPAGVLRPFVTAAG